MSETPTETDEPEIMLRRLEGVDWANDELFVTHTYTDETSQFDPNGRWSPGLECYECEVKVRIPKGIAGNDELTAAFVEMMYDRFPDAEGYYVK